MRLIASFAILLSLASSGCFPERTVLVPAGQPVLILQPVVAHVAHVSGRDANGWPTWSGDTLQTIPAGYVAEQLPQPPNPATQP